MVDDERKRGKWNKEVVHSDTASRSFSMFTFDPFASNVLDSIREDVIRGCQSIPVGEAPPPPQDNQDTLPFSKKEEENSLPATTYTYFQEDSPMFGDIRNLWQIGKGGEATPHLQTLENSLFLHPFSSEIDENLYQESESKKWEEKYDDWNNPSEKIPSSLGLCKFFLSGHCKHGEDCIYSHSQRSLKEKIRGNEIEFRKNPAPCRFFVNGTCKKGGNCIFHHEVNEKTTFNYRVKNTEGDTSLRTSPNDRKNLPRPLKKHDSLKIPPRHERIINREKRANSLDTALDDRDCEDQKPKRETIKFEYKKKEITEPKTVEQPKIKETTPIEQVIQAKEEVNVQNEIEPTKKEDSVTSNQESLQKEEPKKKSKKEKKSPSKTSDVSKDILPPLVSDSSSDEEEVDTLLNRVSLLISDEEGDGDAPSTEDVMLRSFSTLLIGYSQKDKDEVTRIKRCTDHYQVLQVQRDADLKEIQSQYCKIAVKLHPKNNFAPGSLSAFNAATNSYRILSDSKKRSLYDHSLQRGQGTINTEVDDQQESHGIRNRFIHVFFILIFLFYSVFQIFLAKIKEAFRYVQRWFKFYQSPQGKKWCHSCSCYHPSLGDEDFWEEDGKVYIRRNGQVHDVTEVIQEHPSDLDPTSPVVDGFQKGKKKKKIRSKKK